MSRWSIEKVENGWIVIAEKEWEIDPQDIGNPEAKGAEPKAFIFKNRQEVMTFLQEELDEATEI